MLCQSARSLAEWLAYIETVHKSEIEFGLSRITAVAKILGCDRFSAPVIMVAGSNGKGTTATLLATIYQQAGYTVGLYTSPHLIHFNERIQLNLHAIADGALCELFEQIELARGDIKLTFFEYTTLAALLYFKQQHVEVLILENGLGGRLDAVNCIDADCAVITTISLEHQHWLGDTRDAIAIEKAGILRQDRPFVCGDLEPPPTLMAIAKEKSCPAFYNQRDFHFVSHDDGTWSWQYASTTHAQLPPVNLPTQNAATALMVIWQMQSRLPVSDVAIRHACQQCRVPGRMQCISTSPLILLDVAHNPASSEYIHKHYRQRYLPQKQGKLWCLFSMLNDKDIVGTLQPWRECVDHWIIAPIHFHRAAPMTALQTAIETVCPGVKLTICENIADAYVLVKAQASVTDHVLVFGSFYHVGELLLNH